MQTLKYLLFLLFVGTAQPITQVSVLTFNIWDLFVAKSRQLRIKAIIKELKSPRQRAAIRDHDVLTFQEMWSRDTFLELSTQLGDTHPYGHYYDGSPLGSGLAIISKFPIVEVAFHKFNLNGNPVKIFEGDWFVGKGVAYAQLQHPRGTLDIFTTHLIADYSRNVDASVTMDDYRAHRTLQIYEMMEFVRDKTHANSIGIILTGDFNVEMSSVAWKAFIDSQDLLQSIFHGLPAKDIPCTCNCPLNQYAQQGSTPATIDHILYSWECLQLAKFDLAFIAEVPYSIKGDCKGTSCPLAFSDHFGLSAVFTILDRHELSKGSPPRARADAGKRKIAKEALAQIQAEISEEQRFAQGRQAMSLFHAICLMLMLVGTISVAIFIVATPSASASPPLYVLLGLLPALTLGLGLNLIMYFLHYPNEFALLRQFLDQLYYFSRSKAIL